MAEERIRTREGPGPPRLADVLARRGRSDVQAGRDPAFRKARILKSQYVPYLPHR